MKIAVVAAENFDGLDELRERAKNDTIIVSQDAAVLERELPDAEVIAVAPRHGKMLRTLWPKTTRLRWIHSIGAGVEPLMFPELLASDVVLTNSRGIFADGLSEFVIAAMLWFAKDFRRLVVQQAEHLWKPYKVTRIEGQSVGIIGFGGIGSAVARRAHALGMRIFATRRHVDETAQPVERMYRPEQLDEMIAASDYVVVSTPLTPSTRGLVNGQRLAAMKPTAVLINVSRGAVVDEAPLIEALGERRIRGAALDVFQQEPLPPDHPLWSLDNVLLSPHSADRTSDSHLRSMRFFIENLGRYRRGEPLVNLVDKREQY